MLCASGFFRISLPRKSDLRGCSNWRVADGTAILLPHFPQVRRSSSDSTYADAAVEFMPTFHQRCVVCCILPILSCPDQYVLLGVLPLFSLVSSGPMVTPLGSIGTVNCSGVRCYVLDMAENSGWYFGSNALSWCVDSIGGRRPRS